ncbi:MAG: hypothetical protein IJH91_02385 [Mogibacterium sp.]|nr:hypothetical protein [Mogibacterium sp.]
MQVISFTGKSGTGKSYQATRLCRIKNIEAIIDDGLLIYKNRIVAGQSAKKSPTKAGAMRAALFEYDDQREAVQAKLRELAPEKLLVIGTSDRMVDWITDRLEIPSASERVYIEELTTEDEREIAGESRHVRGEHVIPAPIGQLKREFAGYFINPVRMIRGMTMNDGPLVHGHATDRTVVRPQFSYFGTFQISENCIGDIIKIAAESYTDRIKVLGHYHNGNTHALTVVIEVRIHETADIIDLCKALQKEVSTQIEHMTSFQMNRVNIEIKEIELAEDNFSRASKQKYKVRKEK